jgi:hypothetical protein
VYIMQLDDFAVGQVEWMATVLRIIQKDQKCYDNIQVLINYTDSYKSLS